MAVRFASHLLVGDHASRPVATAVPEGTLYSCTDHDVLYQSDTATWSTWATLTSSGITDHTHAATGSGSNGGGATLQPATFDFPAATSPAQTAEGRAVWDSDDDKLTVGTGAGRKTLLNVGDAPTAHASSHQSGGGDAIKLDDLAAPDDNTDLDATTSVHGLLKKLDNNAAHFMNGQGSWATPSAGSVATDAIWDAAGDLAVGSGADTAAKLTKGADGTALRVVSGALTWVALSATDAALGSDATMTNANQFYDGASISLAAGTYLLIATITIRTTAAMDCTAKLWNGTTVIASGEHTIHANTYNDTITLVGVATPSGTETWKISVAGNGTTGTVKAAATNNGAGNNASKIAALRVL